MRAALLVLRGTKCKRRAMDGVAGLAIFLPAVNHREFCVPRQRRFRWKHLATYREEKADSDVADRGLKKLSPGKVNNIHAVGNYSHSRAEENNYGGK
jgi:hypothetical protein